VGRGGFSIIQTIKSTRRMSLFRGGSSSRSVTCGSSNFDSEEQSYSYNMSSSFSSSVGACASEGHRFYVVKSIRQSIDLGRRFNGAIDLAKEATFLSALSGHPNIISLHSTAANPGGLDYFIVIERLRGCMTAEFRAWETQRQSISKSKLLSRKQIADGKQCAMDNRLFFLFGVSSGMSYLHDHK